MKITAATNYNLKELLTYTNYTDFLKAVGFTNIDGIYVAKAGQDLVLYTFDDEQYICIESGASYINEILESIINGKLGLDEILDNLGLVCNEYEYVEQI